MLPNSMGRDFSYHPRTAYDFDLNMDHLVLLDFKALISECSDLINIVQSTKIVTRSCFCTCFFTVSIPKWGVVLIIVTIL